MAMKKSMQFDTKKQIEQREITDILAKGPKDIHVRR